MLTIFTPCYNRAVCLQQVYDSLVKQTCQDFEWIAIDDGSQDNTYDILKRFATIKHDFLIRIFSQKNGGKHRAINHAVQMAVGEYFLILDSDDCLTVDAVEKIKNWCHDIENLPDYSEYAGVSGLRMFPDGSIIGGCGRGEAYIDATNLQRGRFKLNGDKAEVYKTEILKKFPFVEFENENFLSEDTAWNRIAEAGYKLRWYMQSIYIGEYREDGLTRNLKKKNLENFNGYTYTIKERLRLCPMKSKAVALKEYYQISLCKGMEKRQMASGLELSYPIFIVLLGITLLAFKTKNTIRKFANF